MVEAHGTVKADRMVNADGMVKADRMVIADGMVEAFDDRGPAQLICSAKGCRAPAAHRLRWNNPKLHAPAARKTWLACSAHREFLSRFLDLRGFLREVWPLDATPTGGAGAADAATT